MICPTPLDLVPQVLNVVSTWAILHTSGGAAAIDQIIAEAMTASAWHSVGTVTFDYHEEIEEVYGTFFYQLIDENDGVMDDVPPLRDEYAVDYVVVWMLWDRPGGGYGCSGETINPTCDNWLTLRGVQPLCVGAGFYDQLMPDLELEPHLFREQVCPMDFTFDGIVGIDDLLYVLEHWDTMGIARFYTLIADWGSCAD